MKRDGCVGDDPSKVMRPIPDGADRVRRHRES